MTSIFEFIIDEPHNPHNPQQQSKNRALDPPPSPLSFQEFCEGLKTGPFEQAIVDPSSICQKIQRATNLTRIETILRIHCWHKNIELSVLEALVKKLASLQADQTKLLLCQTILNLEDTLQSASTEQQSSLYSEMIIQAGANTEEASRYFGLAQRLSCTTPLMESFLFSVFLQKVRNVDPTNTDEQNALFSLWQQANELGILQTAPRHRVLHDKINRKLRDLLVEKKYTIPNKITLYERMQQAGLAAPKQLMLLENELRKALELHEQNPPGTLVKIFSWYRQFKQFVKQQQQEAEQKWKDEEEGENEEEEESDINNPIKNLGNQLFPVIENICCAHWQWIIRENHNKGATREKLDKLFEEAKSLGVAKPGSKLDHLRWKLAEPPTDMQEPAADATIQTFCEGLILVPSKGEITPTSTSAICKQIKYAKDIPEIAKILAEHCWQKQINLPVLATLVTKLSLLRAHTDCTMLCQTIAALGETNQLAAPPSKETTALFEAMIIQGASNINAAKHYFNVAQSLSCTSPKMANHLFGLFEAAVDQIDNSSADGKNKLFDLWQQATFFGLIDDATRAQTLRKKINQRLRPYLVEEKYSIQAKIKLYAQLQMMGLATSAQLALLENALHKALEPYRDNPSGDLKAICHDYQQVRQFREQLENEKEDEKSNTVVANGSDFANIGNRLPLIMEDICCAHWQRITNENTDQTLSKLKHLFEKAQSCGLAEKDSRLKSLRCKLAEEHSKRIVEQLKSMEYPKDFETFINWLTVCKWFAFPQNAAIKKAVRGYFQLAIVQLLYASPTAPDDIKRAKILVDKINEWEMLRRDSRLRSTLSSQVEKTANTFKDIEPKQLSDLDPAIQLIRQHHWFAFSHDGPIKDAIEDLFLRAFKASPQTPSNMENILRILIGLEQELQIQITLTELTNEAIRIFMTEIGNAIAENPPNWGAVNDLSDRLKKLNLTTTPFFKDEAAKPLLKQMRDTLAKALPDWEDKIDRIYSHVEQLDLANTPYFKKQASKIFLQGIRNTIPDWSNVAKLYRTSKQFHLTDMPYFQENLRATFSTAWHQHHRSKGLLNLCMALQQELGELDELIINKTTEILCWHPADQCKCYLNLFAECRRQAKLNSDVWPIAHAIYHKAPADPVQCAVQCAVQCDPKVLEELFFLSYTCKTFQDGQAIFDQFTINLPEHNDAVQVHYKNVATAYFWLRKQLFSCDQRTHIQVQLPKGSGRIFAQGTKKNIMLKVLQNFQRDIEQKHPGCVSLKLLNEQSDIFGVTLSPIPALSPASPHGANNTSHAYRRNKHNT